MGSVSFFHLRTPHAEPFDLTAGRDGAIWFTEFDGGKLGRIDRDPPERSDP